MHAIANAKALFFKKFREFCIEHDLDDSIISIKYIIGGSCIQ